MVRSVPEWISENHDAKVPPRVQLRIWRRQCGANNFAVCPLSHRPMRADDKRHLHHIKALILGGEHRETNLVWVLADANADEAKTEVATKAKNDARAAKNLGIKSGGKTGLEGRTPKEKHEARAARSSAKIPVPPPRSLYQ